MDEKTYEKLLSEATEKINELEKQIEDMTKPVEPIYYPTMGSWHCGKCGHGLILVVSEHDKGRLGIKYCTTCGRPVEWGKQDD